MRGAGWREPADPRLLGAVIDGSTGYRRLALAGAHLDAPGVRFLRLGYQYVQDTVLGGRLDLVRLDMPGHCDRPAEHAVMALGPVDLISVRVRHVLPLALDRQHVILERELHVVDPEARQFRGHQVGILALGDIDRGWPRLTGRTGYRPLAEMTRGPVARHPALPHKLILRAVQVIE